MRPYIDNPELGDDVVWKLVYTAIVDYDPGGNLASKLTLILAS
jgi:hypothetical protein